MECLFYYTGKYAFLYNKNAPRGCAECAKEGCFTVVHSHWERNKSHGD